jgi:hypothetical protein
VGLDGSSIAGGDVFATCPAGLCDGFRVDGGTTPLYSVFLNTRAAPRG